MSSTLTPRLSLPYPTASMSPNGPAQMGALALALDNLAGPYSQGILANQPTSTSGSPGIQGRFYLVDGDPTPANNGILWVDYGTGWLPIGGAFTDAQITGSPTNVLAATGDLLYASAANVLAALSPGAAGQIVGLIAGVPGWVYPPGYEWSNTLLTAPVAVTSTTEATPTTVVAAGSVTYDGAACMFEFWCPYVNITGVSQTCTVCLFEGATNLGRFWPVESAGIPSGAGSNGGVTVISPNTGRFRYTPSAGAHTYKVAAFSSASSGATIEAGAGGTATLMPAFLRVTKV